MRITVLIQLTLLPLASTLPNPQLPSAKGTTSYPTYTAEVFQPTASTFSGSISIATPWGPGVPCVGPAPTCPTGQGPPPFAGIQSFRATATYWQTLFWPGPITAFPATVAVTRVSTIVMTSTDLISSSYSTGPPGTWTVHTGESTGSYTKTSTWFAFKAEATHLPAGTRREDLPCSSSDGKEESGNADRDPYCEKIGWTEGCMGQCKLREDGNFWCLLSYAEFEGGDGVVGRVCWSRDSPGGLSFLSKPCLRGDLRPSWACDAWYQHG
ncbi:hypothetical protein B0H63DRAFT_480535 [Podospora didyma]|uniref:Uncharacterized protein n=1 Tax=Podospora didyma TaxID=330526 RepID=A0AAE0N8E5_9PEZI|nr:hypothetical protein B0H63DRAFT_480535 [Podospora didyma]